MSKNLQDLSGTAGKEAENLEVALVNPHRLQEPMHNRLIRCKSRLVQVMELSCFAKKSKKDEEKKFALANEHNWPTGNTRAQSRRALGFT